MNLKNRLNDSFVTGLFIGGGTLVLFYLLVNLFRLLLIKLTGDNYLLKPPTVQLYSVGLNVLLFRWFMINLEKENIAKGILFVTVTCVLVYFIVYYKVNSPA